MNIGISECQYITFLIPKGPEVPKGDNWGIIGSLGRLPDVNFHCDFLNFFFCECGNV
jgi:hypothetical protein